MDAYDAIKWLEGEYNKLSEKRRTTDIEDWEGSFDQERLWAIVSLIEHLKHYTELTMADDKRKRDED